MYKIIMQGVDSSGDYQDNVHAYAIKGLSLEKGTVKFTTPLPYALHFETSAV